ncbi:hypothetical protein N9A94_07910 [Akkermansiaceae bacterium]|nr:hypothetical protein [Akkermansiaceae bacterium]
MREIRIALFFGILQIVVLKSAELESRKGVREVFSAIHLQSELEINDEPMDVVLAMILKALPKKEFEKLPRIEMVLNLFQLSPDLKKTTVYSLSERSKKYPKISIFYPKGTSLWKIWDDFFCRLCLALGCERQKGDRL